MTLSLELQKKGFSICDVEQSDFSEYYRIMRTCYEKYVIEYFGGWVEEIQIKMNQDAFSREKQGTFFKKILLNNATVGFFAFDLQNDKIDGISIQMLACARSKGIGSFFLDHIVSLANQQNKPAFLRVFMSNPAQELYKRFGFQTYDKTNSHYLMKYQPGAFHNEL